MLEDDKVNGMSNKLLTEGLWVNHVGFLLVLTLLYLTLFSRYIPELEYEMNVAQRCAIHLLFLQRV